MSKKEGCGLCEKLGLKPLTKENVFQHYIPMHCVLSYGALAVNVLNPAIIPEILPKKLLTNIFLLSTASSASIYVYGRPHIQKLPTKSKVQYAIFGGAVFSMASVLTWAIIKALFPQNNSFLTTVAGIGTGAYMVKVSRDYFRDCDNVVKGEK